MILRITNASSFPARCDHGAIPSILGVMELRYAAMEAYNPSNEENDVFIAAIGAVLFEKEDIGNCTVWLSWKKCRTYDVDSEPRVSKDLIIQF